MDKHLKCPLLSHRWLQFEISSILLSIRHFENIIASRFRNSKRGSFSLLCNDNVYGELVPEEVTYKRYSSNNNGRYRNCSSHRYFHSSSLFDFSRERKEGKKRKVFVFDQVFTDRSIFPSFEFENFLDLARGNTIQFDLFWIDLNNNRIINTYRMFKRINPFVMILSGSWKLFKLLLKIHIIADKIFNT